MAKASIVAAKQATAVADIDQRVQRVEMHVGTILSLLTRTFASE